MPITKIGPFVKNDMMFCGQRAWVWNVGGVSCRVRPTLRKISPEHCTPGMVCCLGSLSYKERLQGHWEYACTLYTLTCHRLRKITAICKINDLAKHQNPCDRRLRFQDDGDLQVAS